MSELPNTLTAPQQNAVMQASWKSFIRASLTMEQMRVDSAPAEAGVYFLWRGTGLLYVGKATDIATRMDQHRKDGRILFSAVSVVLMHRDLSPHAESGFLFGLRPPMNRKYVRTWWDGCDRMARLVNRTWRKWE